MASTYEPCFPTEQTKLEVWQASEFQSFNAIDLSNRYFSARALTEGKPEVQFTREEDPEGILASMISNSLTHTAGNVVQYCETAGKDKEGATRCVPVSLLHISEY